MKIDGFCLLGTGGNCEALFMRAGGYDFLLTDDNLSAPDSSPAEMGWYEAETSYWIGGAIVHSEYEVRRIVEAVQREQPKA